ncbi:hypothetical protein VPARA_12800 [Variovorax paradoxus]|uniref:Uncharacterized protein n=1 Tax=Variovorax paradoxus TaxID=34073 RepID=A0A0H2MAR2_VARPD|nr:hypothetical protein VPARA_12800 [Variovorax paradoxus]
MCAKKGKGKDTGAEVGRFDGPRKMFLMMTLIAFTIMV